MTNQSQNELIDYDSWFPTYECTCGWEGKCPPLGWATWGFGRTVLREQVPICPKCLHKPGYDHNCVQVYEKGKHPFKFVDRIFDGLKERMTETEVVKPDHDR